MLPIAKAARSAAVTRRTAVDVKKVGNERGVAMVKRDLIDYSL